MQLASKTYDVDDICAAQELYHANGWTDGLPIVPPTADAVQACLEWAMTAAGATARHRAGARRARSPRRSSPSTPSWPAACRCISRSCSPRSRRCCSRSSCCTARPPPPAAARCSIVLNGPIRRETRRSRHVQRAGQQRSRHRGDRPRDPPRADQHPGGAARRHRPLHPRPSGQVQLLRRRGRGGHRLAAACTCSAGCRRRCRPSPSWRPARRGRS